MARQPITWKNVNTRLDVSPALAIASGNNLVGGFDTLTKMATDQRDRGILAEENLKKQATDNAMAQALGLQDRATFGQDRNALMAGLGENVDQLQVAQMLSDRRDTLDNRFNTNLGIQKNQFTVDNQQGQQDLKNLQTNAQIQNNMMGNQYKQAQIRAANQTFDANTPEKLAEIATIKRAQDIQDFNAKTGAELALANVNNKSKETVARNRNKNKNKNLSGGSGDFKPPVGLESSFWNFIQSDEEAGLEYSTSGQKWLGKLPYQKIKAGLGAAMDGDTFNVKKFDKIMQTELVNYTADKK